MVLLLFRFVKVVLLLFRFVKVVLLLFRFVKVVLFLPQVKGQPAAAAGPSGGSGSILLSLLKLFLQWFTERRS